MIFNKLYRGTKLFNVFEIQDHMIKSQYESCQMVATNEMIRFSASFEISLIFFPNLSILHSNEQFSVFSNMILLSRAMAHSQLFLQWNIAVFSHSKRKYIISYFIGTRSLGPSTWRYGERNGRRIIQRLVALVA